jgi:hypothetical protein
VFRFDYSRIRALLDRSPATDMTFAREKNFRYFQLAPPSGVAAPLFKHGLPETTAMCTCSYRRDSPERA